MPPDTVSESAASLAQRLKPGDLDATLEQITRAAVDLLPDVACASISVRYDDRISTVAATEPLLLAIDEQQYLLEEGPCYHAATDVPQVIAPDLEHDDRFPRYGPMAVEAGVHAQAAFRLFETRGSLGALNLYSTKPGAFADLEDSAALFRSEAAVAVAFAHEITNLSEALETRSTIGKAMGIVMERYSLDEERAFAFLARLSQHRNVKLRLIAEELVAERGSAG